MLRAPRISRKTALKRNRFSVPTATVATETIIKPKPVKKKTKSKQEDIATIEVITDGIEK